MLAAARERASLHGGTVDSRLAGGVCYAMARLPAGQRPCLSHPASCGSHPASCALRLSWRSDLLLAAIVAGWALIYLGLVAPPRDRRWLVLVLRLPYAAALSRAAALAGGRRRRGLRGAGGGVAARPSPGGQRPASRPVLLDAVSFAHSLGAEAGLATGLAGAALLAVGLQLANAGVFNPILA